jgi:hypothetical protein
VAVAVLATAWLAPATTHLTAYAADSCTGAQSCRWTQESNNNWSPGNGTPGCNPCVHWPTDGSDFANMYDNSFYGSGSMWEHDVDWAARTWSSLQYNAPNFDELQTSGCGCGYQLQYGVQSLASTLCGWTQIFWDSSGIMTSADVWLSSNAPYVDGPTREDCDLKDTLLHETGHAFGEGHSSIGADLMYPSNNSVEAIDQDALNMMATVYGTYAGDGCGGCQAGTHGHAVGTAGLDLNQIAFAIEVKNESAALAAQAAVSDAQNAAGSEKSAAQACVSTPVACAAIGGSGRGN